MSVHVGWSGHHCILLEKVAVKRSAARPLHRSREKRPTNYYILNCFEVKTCPRLERRLLPRVRLRN